MEKSKSNSVKIRVRDYFSESISSRDAIALLFNRKFEPEQTIIVDFSDIVFITRSATHQLIKEIERLEERFKCRVVMESLHPEILSMLKIVRESHSYSSKQNSEVQQVFFKTSSELNQFLMQF